MWSLINKTFTQRVRLIEAFCNGFPPELRESVKRVGKSLPSKTYSNTQHFISEKKITYFLRDYTISFPYRMYLHEIDNDEKLKLSDLEKKILHCIYTRSCDGYVREKHITELLKMDIPDWSIPFIIKVCDEYVVEILETVYKSLEGQNTDEVKRFCINNWDSLCLSYNRMISYWNEFYRNDCYRFHDYVGRKLFIECFGAKRTMNYSKKKLIIDEKIQWNQALYRVDKPSLSTFEFSDCWLLLSIGISNKGSTLKGILQSGDSYNHTMFSLNELNYGMSKLIENGYVLKSDKRFQLTEKAKIFLKINEEKKEGHIASLFRLSPIFQKEEVKKDCNLTNFFYEDNTGKYRML